MRTGTQIYIGSAQRTVNGTIDHYVIGRNRTFISVEKAYDYIRGLFDGYKSRGVDLPKDEFVPVEIQTTYHDPII